MSIAVIVAGAVVAGLMAFAAACYVASDKVPSIKMKGARVVITGGSEGLGLCLSQLLVRGGSHLVVISRNQGKLDKALEVLKKESKDAVRHRIHRIVNCPLFPLSSFSSTPSFSLLLSITLLTSHFVFRRRRLKSSVRTFRMQSPSRPPSLVLQTSLVEALMCSSTMPESLTRNDSTRYVAYIGQVLSETCECTFQPSQPRFPDTIY